MAAEKEGDGIALFWEPVATFRDVTSLADSPVVSPGTFVPRLCCLVSTQSWGQIGGTAPQTPEAEASVMQPGFKMAKKVAADTPYLYCLYLLAGQHEGRLVQSRWSK